MVVRSRIGIWGGILNFATIGCLLSLAATPAVAQSSFLSCLDQTQSWSQGFSAGAIAAVTYIVSMPTAPAPPVTYVRPGATLGWLIKASRTGGLAGINATEILTNMPQNVARQYQGLTNADAKFASDRTRFRELLLIDGTGCPLLLQDAQYSLTGTPLWVR